MKGRYPKSFKWVGWHPNDLCYVVPIIKSEEKWREDENNRGNDNDEITDVPQGFKTWVANNQDRISKAEKRGTLPYFVRDNKSVVRQFINEGNARGGMKGRYLGRKEEKEAYIAYSKKGNSVTSLTDTQIENRNQLAKMLGIPKEDTLPSMTHEEANGREPNKDYKIGTPYADNCQSCVIAYEVRRRGLNVTALGFDGIEGSPSYLLSYDCTLAFSKASAITINPKGKKLNSRMITDATKTQGRYLFGWDKANADGYIIIAERMKDNSLVFYDPQDGTYWSINDIKQYSQGSIITSLKIDQLLLNNDLVKNLLRTI